MNIEGALAATNAFKEAIKGNVVSPAQVLDRANICASCPKRKPVVELGLKTRVSQRLGQLANSHRVPEEVREFGCGVCGCALLLLLPCTKENLHKDSPDERARRPKFCWIKRIK